MSLPPPTPASRRTPAVRALTLVLALLVALPLLARGPDPPQRIPLEALGFQTISPRYLLQGATMVTVDFVDARHLLVTFAVSRLMPRLAGCPEEDEDRTVRAVLLELPTGRELAHTEWRFHDLGRYLWDLGDGHFLLRNRDALSILSPVENLASGAPFAEQPFLHFDRRIATILVSANRELLSIETVKHSPSTAAAAPIGAQASAQTGSQTSSQAGRPASQSPSTILTKGLQRRDPNGPKTDQTPEPTPDPTPVQVDFVRILKADTPGRADVQGTADISSAPPASAALHPIRFMGRIDGRIFTQTAVNVPLTTEGFLRTKGTTRDGVLLDFLTFAGKDIDLGDFATSCPPRPTFVSPSEFVAFGCRGDAESLDLAGFNLRGDFLWQLNFTDEQAYPSFASAIPAGRFAFSRTVTATHVFGNETPSVDQLLAQEVRVLQMYNGKQLLKVVTSPIQRAGQNFTLSPDGLALAVIHDIATATKGDMLSHHTSVEIYKLPPLSEKDLAQIKLEAAMAPAPPDPGVHMRFSSDEIKAAVAARPDTAADSEAPAPPPLPGPKASGPKASAPADSHVADADAPPEKPRKPPTLYEPAPPATPQ